MQLAAARDLEGVGRLRLFHAHAHVGLDLFEQAVAQVARGDELALLPGKGAVVDDEVHGDGRLVDLDERQRLDALGVAGGFADIQIGDARHADQIARHGALDLHALEPLKLIQPRDALIFGRAVGLAQHHVLPAVDLAALHAPHADAPDVIVVFQRGKQNLQRRIHFHMGRLDLSQNGVEQGAHIARTHLGVERRIALLRAGVDHGEFELIVVRAQLDEQIKHFVEHLLGSRARAVDLVDHHQRLFA